MTDIPGIGIFSGREFVTKTNNDFEFEITTNAVLQPHEVSYLASLGWIVKNPTTFAYTKLKPIVEENLDEITFVEYNAPEYKMDIVEEE